MNRVILFLFKKTSIFIFLTGFILALFLSGVTLLLTHFSSFRTPFSFFNPLSHKFLELKHCSFSACLDYYIAIFSLPITPKLHVISIHLKQWIRRTGVGLAKANEAAGEAAHHTWWEVWKNYKVNTLIKPSFVCQVY